MNHLTREGAATGTALFYQSGQFLLIGGPATLLLAYVWVSTVAYSMLVHITLTRG
jgi:amino acid permease